MKTKFLWFALTVSAATIAQANPGAFHAGSGGFHGRAVARSAPAVHAPMRGGAPSVRAPMRAGGISSFHSTPMRAYGSRLLYSGQRYSSFGMRSSPSSAYRRPYISSSRGSFTRSGPYTVATIPQRNRVAPFANHRNPAVTSAWNQRNTATQFRSGNNLWSGNNLRNPNNFRNGNNRRIGNNPRNGNNVRNGNNRLRANWQKHVFAQRSGDWHRDWDRNCDHWWNGHQCCFINGSWVIFNVGFYPWWPSYYPDNYYYYDYGFPNDG